MHLGFFEREDSSPDVSSDDSKALGVGKRWEIPAPNRFNAIARLNLISRPAIPVFHNRGIQLRWNEHPRGEIAPLPSYPTSDTVERMMMFVKRVFFRDFPRLAAHPQPANLWEFPGFHPHLIHAIDYADGDFTIRVSVINPDRVRWGDITARNPNTLRVAKDERGTGDPIFVNNLSLYVFLHLLSFRPNNMAGVLRLSEGNIEFAYRVYYTPTSISNSDERSSRRAPSFADTMNELWGERAPPRVAQAGRHFEPLRAVLNPQGECVIL
ncbi:MAG: hypothetical protein M1831_001946 [Alyxoria varia]|nr:MAG: hypothetical protein M1831_001946 [Alyxoria varia]